MDRRPGSYESSVTAQANTDDGRSGGRLPAGPLLSFFAITFAATWALWIAAAALTEPGSGLRTALLLPGTFMPAVVAILLIARIDGPEGTRALLRRLVDWRVGVRWYVFAVAFLAAVKLTAALVIRGATGDWPALGQTPVMLVIVGVAGSTIFQAGEEIGWRGYALPRLASRFGLGPASVLLGPIWAVWHLPLFFLPGGDEGPFPMFLLYVTGLSIGMAWLFANTRGSLLLAMLMHSAFNNTQNIVPSAAPGDALPLWPSISSVAWVTVALLWLAGGYFLIRMSGRRAVAAA
jgi:membrane protease YdiL (CAAX protease family)